MGMDAKIKEVSEYLTEGILNVRTLRVDSLEHKIIDYYQNKLESVF